MTEPEDFLHLLSLHKDATASLLDRASRLCPEDLDISTDPKVIRIRHMVSSVLGEMHGMRGFVRLTPLGKRVLYGYLKPQHDVGARVSVLLARRFPGTIIVLGNNCRSTAKDRF